MTLPNGQHGAAAARLRQGLRDIATFKPEKARKDRKDRKDQKAQSSQALHIGNSGSDQENQPGGPKLSPDRGNTTPKSGA